MAYEMDKQKALEVLKVFQRWRCGFDERTLSDLPITCKDITKAIDFAIMEMSESANVTDVICDILEDDE